jgi:bacillithiol biosynthesis cysteine-adding enzyme BshC
MTSKHTTTLPFAEWGPTDRYWLDAFDPGSALHQFLPVGPVDTIPFPSGRMKEWENGAERREQVVEAFRETSLPLSARQRKAIDDLAAPNAMAVVTGQQPGALGGPLYTFAKILSAIVFAETLSEKWEVPVVPILWDGGDDHDLEEIAVLKWLGSAEGTPTKTFDLSDYSGQSAWEVPFTRGLFEESIEFITGRHPATDYREATLEFLNGLWEEGVTWCDFFDRFWLKVFEDSPLLVVRPWEDGFRRLAEDVFEREIENPQAYLEDLAQTSGALSSADYSPRIHKTEGTCSFFYYHEGRRCPVSLKEDGTFTSDGVQPHSKREILSAYRNDPSLLSPNALLRPLVQDAILPTAAAVLGPSEVAYHAQIGKMYARHEIVRPFILPRISLSLIGANQRSKMEEIPLALTDLPRNANEITKSLISSEDLDTMLAVLDDLTERTKAGREKILTVAREAKFGSQQGIDSQFRRIDKTLNQISDLLRRDEMKRNSELATRIKGLQELLLPDGDLQERSVGLVPFLCRFGFDWLEPMREEAPAWTGREHVIYTP